MAEILSQSELKKTVIALKKQGRKIVVTNGVFDLLHLAHIHILQKCKSMGDILIVLINSDSSVKGYKGDKSPVVPETDRVELLANFPFIDYITIFNEDTPLSILKEIKPDILAKGGAFIQERIAREKQLLESWGGKFITFPLEKEYSSTNIIKKILEAYKDEPVRQK